MFDARKKRTIKRRPKGSTSIMYFNADTHKAIVEYQKTDDWTERNRLYKDVIFPAFDKLVENLINIHSFSGLHDNHSDIKHDCVTFLFETIHKFDDTRGTKAFSYFNVVAKNWLTVKTKQKSLTTKKMVSMDCSDQLSSLETRIIDEKYIIPSQDEEYDKESDKSEITELLLEIRDLVETENELLCINALITIFETIDDLDMIGKNAVTVYMKELSGLNSKQLTLAMQSIRRHYYDIKDEFDISFFEA